MFFEEDRESIWSNGHLVGFDEKTPQGWEFIRFSPDRSITIIMMVDDQDNLLYYARREGEKFKILDWRSPDRKVEIDFENDRLTKMIKKDRNRTMIALLPKGCQKVKIISPETDKIREMRPWIFNIINGVNGHLSEARGMIRKAI